MPTRAAANSTDRSQHCCEIMKQTPLFTNMDDLMTSWERLKTEAGSTSEAPVIQVCGTSLAESGRTSKGAIYHFDHVFVGTMVTPNSPAPYSHCPTGLIVRCVYLQVLSSKVPVACVPVWSKFAEQEHTCLYLAFVHSPLATQQLTCLAPSRFRRSQQSWR